MNNIKLVSEFDTSADLVFYPGDCRDLLKQIPDQFVKLVVTSPPYNLGKPYENRIHLTEYLEQQKQVITECVRVLNDHGSLCWQVGNYVTDGEIVPLDMALYPTFAQLGLHMRNRIIWHFEHGLHTSKRFSGRYEVILWFTKGEEYTFNLDPVRVPQKYPQKKYFKGPRRGEYSGNPLGKNPGDVWILPNVKANHVEKTIHPCQFPVELIERLVLALTDEEDWVLDPFMGVGTTAIAALIHKRRAIGAEIVPEYVEVAEGRIHLAEEGKLRIRPMDRPVYDPNAPHISVPPKVVNLKSDVSTPRLMERVVKERKK
jgi:adenine-specific DNA-methyltransferase